MHVYTLFRFNSRCIQKYQREGKRTAVRCSVEILFLLYSLFSAVVAWMTIDDVNTCMMLDL